MDQLPQTYQKGSFGIKCMKILLILMNVLFLIISFLMISGATTLKVIFGEYYYVLWSASTVDSLSSLWIATGCFLLALSIFGIVAAIKESTAMTNFYGLFMALIFILQIAAAITGFTLITQTDGIVNESLGEMMRRNGYGYDNTMDWVQQTFRCCGNDGPSDWERYGRYSTPYPWTTHYYPWYETSTTTEPPTTVDYTNRMPQSCCTAYSNYDNYSLRCQQYFPRGCHGPLHEILSQSVMIWGSSALIISVVQILGVACAFGFARIIRRNKTNRDIHRWAIHESLGFDRPTTFVDRAPNSDRTSMYVNQTPNASEPNMGDVKHM